MKIFIADFKSLLNLRDFKYEIPLECNASHLIWIITSYAGDASKRSSLRRAYNSKELADLGIQRVFLLGKLDELSEQKSGISQSAIENEAHRFKDIVQGNFLEAYRNLTYKHIMGLKWSVENCDHVSYIMKMDDDIVINLYEVLDKLENIVINNSIAGYVFENMLPIRDPANKWFVTKDEFADDSYPRFLSGWLYVTTYSVISKLMEQANSHSKYFWIDDVFVTGILREKSNIGIVNIGEMYTTDFGFIKCCIKGGKEKLKCEFAVGPNGGDAELQVQFQEFASHCRSTCNPRPKNSSVQKTCVLAYKEDLGKGSAQVSPVNIV